MKWKTDLVKDIRFGDERDTSEAYPRFYKDYLPEYFQVNEIENGGSFSECNKSQVENILNSIKDRCKCIVEIGVDRRTKSIKRTSTETILNNKADDVLYLGIDLKDKSYLNNPAKNIYTLQTKSENTDEIISYLNSLGKTQIDFLFIDGFHSVNQVYLDWELTCILSPNGVVGFHDTAYHPGPHLFVKNMDRSKWKVSENCCNHTPDDYGIGFAWKISD